MIEVPVETRAHTQFVPLNTLLQQVVREHGPENGVLHVHIPHTTAGITINENADPDVVSDITETLARLIPWDNGYAHGEGNSAAHLKASLMGFSVTLPVENRKLRLGTWQGVYFCEFDGPRHRKIWVTPLPA